MYKEGMKKTYHQPRYKVTLTRQERSMLEELTRKGKATAFKHKHARALLLCDRGEHGDGNEFTMEEIAKAVGVNTRTIERIKERFVNEGLESATSKKPRKSRKIIFDGAFSARLTRLACSPAPEGHARWTLRLLAEKVVELKIAPTVSPQTVYLTLKKTNLSLT
jgi:transposase